MESFSFEFLYHKDAKHLWVDCALNDQDKQTLITLMREIRIISSISERTGLRLVDSFELDDRLCTVTILEKELVLEEDELCVLRNFIKEHKIV